MTIAIYEKSAGLSYAAKELRRFLEEYTNAEILRGDDGKEADRRVTLEVDEALPAHCW